MNTGSKKRSLSQLLCYHLTFSGQNTAKRGQGVYPVLFLCYDGSGDLKVRRVANWLVQFCFGRNEEFEEKKEIYQYGMMLFLTSFLGIASILLISVLFFNIIDGIVFLTVFCGLRMFAGGLHCKSYSSCFLLSNFIYILNEVVVVLICRIHPVAIVICIVLLVCIAYLYIIRNAPITVKRRVLSCDQIKTNRMRAAFLATIVSLGSIIVAILLYRHPILLLVCALVATTETSVSVLMLIQKNKERRNEHARDAC